MEVPCPKLGSGKGILEHMDIMRRILKMGGPVVIGIWFVDRHVDYFKMRNHFPPEKEAEITKGTMIHSFAPTACGISIYRIYSDRDVIPVGPRPWNLAKPGIWLQYNTERLRQIEITNL